MPALEALLPKFFAAHTQPLGLSIDSVYCHANWGSSLGGVSFPLLADFHPKGKVAQSLGAYLEPAGITDRATVLIDAAGVVRFSEAVTPAGKRDIAALVAECERLDKEFDGSVEAVTTGAGLPSGSQLFVKSNCGFSRAAMLARDNLHLGDRLPLRNVSEDPSAMEALKKLTGKEQAPCLVHGDDTLLESADIITKLRNQSLGW